MKVIIAIFIVLNFSFSTLAGTHVAPNHQNVLIQILANDLGLKDVVLYNLFAKRCTRYLPSTDHKKCQESVTQLIGLLDSDILFPETQSELYEAYAPQAFLFVAFKKNLIDILSDPQTTEYLNDIQIELNNYALGENPDFNLWNFSQKFYGNSAKTIKVMSALYQDTSHARLHLNFLEKAKIRGRQNFTTNKELLQKFLESLTLIMEVRQESLHELLYPPGTQPTLNKNMYHFYVPLYLSVALREKKIDPYFSYVAPMIMTLTYEFVTAASDYRYILNDPDVLTGNEWKIRDIFAGHQGASLGAGRKTIKEYTFLKANFGMSVKNTVKAMLAR